MFSAWEMLQKKHLSLLQGQVLTCGTTLFDAVRILSAECHHTLCPLRRLRVAATWLMPFTLPSEAHFAETVICPARTAPDSLGDRSSALLPRLRFCINLQ